VDIFYIERLEQDLGLDKMMGEMRSFAAEKSFRDTNEGRPMPMGGYKGGSRCSYSSFLRGKKIIIISEQ